MVDRLAELSAEMYNKLLDGPEDARKRLLDAHLGRLPSELLMSPTNPTGWKLEDILGQLIKEVALKTSKIAADNAMREMPKGDIEEGESFRLANTVVENNLYIMKSLSDARHRQNQSYHILDRYKNNQGPLGTPRIGEGTR